MITKIRFRRTSDTDKPEIVIFIDGYELHNEITEDVYAEWVPDTNGPGYKGENLKDGIFWEKPIIPNLKG